MGVPCTINTDNMILSDISLDKEYDHCIREMGLSYADLIRCNINSARASFLEDAPKAALIESLLACLDTLPGKI